MKWMTIDPGISGTGIALFQDKKLMSWHNLIFSKGYWRTKCVSYCIALLNYKIAFGPEKIFCEWPSNFTGSAAGLAALNSGSILKLSYLIGRFDRTLNGMELISVQKWKGQLDKTVVAGRVHKWLDKRQPKCVHAGLKSHAMDAAGIGKYIIEETDEIFKRQILGKSKEN